MIIFKVKIFKILIIRVSVCPMVERQFNGNFYNEFNLNFNIFHINYSDWNGLDVAYGKNTQCLYFIDKNILAYSF